MNSDFEKKNMKSQMDYPSVYLKPGREKSLHKGHPWVFSGAIEKASPELHSGDIASIWTSHQKPLGLGFYHAKADIALRLLTPEIHTKIDKTFWTERLKQALSLRDQIIPSATNAYRLINAEGDGFPGLVVDRYGDILVMEVGTAGMDKQSSTIVEILIQFLTPKAIVEKSQSKSRHREGLSDRTQVLYGSLPSEWMTISENGLLFYVDILKGQKTGFFLDQRENRQLVASLAKDKNVLNCFSYTGAFSVYGIKGGAKRVVSVESSSSANTLAKENFLLNHISLEMHPILEADVFDFFRTTNEIFDLIILDPPAFAKSKNDVQKALRGYKEINLQAVKKLSKGGFLFTFSCSNFVDDRLFEFAVLSACNDAQRQAQILKRLAPGSDHPTLLGHPEGRYLKGLLLRVK